MEVQKKERMKEKRKKASGKKKEKWGPRGVPLALQKNKLPEEGNKYITMVIQEDTNSQNLTSELKLQVIYISSLKKSLICIY